MILKIQVLGILSTGVPDMELIPRKAFETDAGMDLKSAENVDIAPHSTKLVNCGIAIELPVGYEAQVRSRSGLAGKSGIFVLNSPGTIDANYRGPVGVILHNTTDTVFKITKYDRIAQMVINQLPEVVVEVVEVLSSTDRGVGGFGSTGK